MGMALINNVTADTTAPSDMLLLNPDWNIRLPETPKAYHQLNFKWRSQRQVRKRRRKAHAAGKKNAFC